MAEEGMDPNLVDPTELTGGVGLETGGSGDEGSGDGGSVDSDE